MAATNFAGWGWLNRPHVDDPWSGVLRGVSFSPFQKDDDPIAGRFPTLRDIDRDLSLLDGKVAGIRTYAALEGLEHVPEAARKYGIKVTAGAWLDDRLGKNEAELGSVIALARRHDNVERVIVGNEALHRRDVTVPQLIRYLRRVKEKVRVPVSTAEPWYVWLKYPELAREVDFIAIHILPYWEGVPAEEAVGYLLSRYYEIRRAFPDKPVAITEVGWPSGGKSRKLAEPSLVNQAMFMRKFLSVAEVRGIDYNVIEAFDQPWKRRIEWSVGAHWGLWDAERNPKFSWTGPVVEFAGWPALAAAAFILALLPAGWVLLRWRHWRATGRLFYALLAQGAASLVVWTAAMPLLGDYAPVAWLMYGILLPAQLLLLAVVLINGFEFAELTFARRLKRRFRPFTPDSARRLPKVSLHLAICNEPPEMVEATIDRLVGLDYPNLEILVVDNNTGDEAVWRPVEAHCERLRERIGDRLRFFHLPQWPGYKAGALNFALSRTAADAEIVGVVDSDYAVAPDWLMSLVPYFDSPKVGWVQAPQDHREWQGDTFKGMMNWEYAGFFDIGMVARNEANAIIQHGTMTLIRRSALSEAGGWGEWCICEDAELGLRLLRAGYESVYVQHRFGHGLTPDTFLGYKKQRFRWAFGAMQIMKHHWRALLPFARGLTAGQKYHFVAGWLPWLADAFYLLFAVLSILWSLGLVLAPHSFDFPLALFVMPTIGVFFVKIAHHLFLYRRVGCGWRQRIGSAVAGMALTYSIAIAVWQGLFKKSTPFFRTPKCEDKAAFAKGLAMAAEETLLMLALWASAAAVLLAGEPDAPEARLWAVVLGVQSLPFAAALATSMISAQPALGLRRLWPMLLAERRR